MSTNTLAMDTGNAIAGAPSFTTTSYAVSVNDSDDASYVSFPNGEDDILEFDIDDIIPVGLDLVALVKLNVRHNATQPMIVDWYTNFVYGGSSGQLVYSDVLTPVGSITTQTLQAKLVAPDGNAWTEESINNIQLMFRGSDNQLTFRIYEISMDVVYYSKPTVSVTSPVSNATVRTTRPMIEWEPQDQAKYRIRTFPVWQVAENEFDPNTSIPVYDSDWITSAFGTGLAIDDDDLLHGQAYKSYVFVEDVHGLQNLVTEADSFASFTVDVVVPSVPTIVATNNETIQGMELAIDTHLNILYTRDGAGATDDVSFEDGTYGWFDGAVLTDCTKSLLNSLTNTVDGGTRAVRLTGTAADFTAEVAGYTTNYNDGVRRVSVVAHVRTGTASRPVRCYLRWYTGVGAFISDTEATSQWYVSPSSSTAWRRLTATGEPPSNATFFRVMFEYDGTATSQTMDIDVISVFYDRMPQLVSRPYMNINNDVSGSQTPPGWSEVNGGSELVVSMEEDLEFTQMFGVSPVTKIVTETLGGTATGLQTNQTIPTLSWPDTTDFEVSVLVKVLTDTDVTVAVPGYSETVTQTVLASAGWTRVSLFGTTTTPGDQALRITTTQDSKTILVGIVQAVPGSTSFTEWIPEAWSMGNPFTGDPEEYDTAVDYILERSTDGETWSRITRTAPDLNDVQTIVSAAGGWGMVAEVVDYEAPRGQTVYYRAKALHIDSDGNYRASNWSPFAASDSMVGDDEWWLKPIDHLELARSFEMKGPNWKRRSNEQASFYNPIGRDRAVKVSDVIMGDEFSFTVFILSQQDEDDLEEMRRSGIILVQAPASDGRQWYCNFENLFDVDEQVVAATPYRELTISFKEANA